MGNDKHQKRQARAAGPSQRQLRVAEEIRHALAAVFTRGDLRDPDLADARVTVTEVRASPDLRHMTVFVSHLGRPADAALLRRLKDSQPELRTRVARAVRLRSAPELHFENDSALDYAMTVDALMRRPEVARDLGSRPEGKPPEGQGPEEREEPGPSS